MSWLPFAIHRRWRRVLPATPASQVLLTVGVFAPCLGGTYGAWWLIPFFQEALETAAMFLTGTPRPSGFLRFTVLPPLVWWTLVWLAMRRRRGLFQSRRPLAWIPARPAGR